MDGMAALSAMPGCPCEQSKRLTKRRREGSQARGLSAESFCPLLLAGFVVHHHVPRQQMVVRATFLPFAASGMRCIAGNRDGLAEIVVHQHVSILVYAARGAIAGMEQIFFCNGTLADIR